MHPLPSHLSHPLALCLDLDGSEAFDSDAFVKSAESILRYDCVGDGMPYIR